jgi:dipeptidyl-peptidase-4
MQHRSTRVVTTVRRAIMPVLGLVAFASPASIARAQDRLKTMPGYDQYARVAPQIPGSVKLGTLQAFWIDSGKSFEYQQDGKWFRFDVATRKAAEISGLTRR